MGNFITEDDIEQAILAKLQAPPFAYNILRCPASPDMRDDLQDGTGRSSKKECILPLTRFVCCLMDWKPSWEPSMLLMITSLNG